MRRVASEADRRAVRVEITEAGEEAHQRMWSAVGAFNRQLVSGMGKDDLRELERVLGRLEDNARRVDAAGLRRAAADGAPPASCYY